jgi:hypothetical protein
MNRGGINNISTLNILGGVTPNESMIVTNTLIQVQSNIKQASSRMDLGNPGTLNSNLYPIGSNVN